MAPTRENREVAVVAADIGTARSGYAFAFAAAPGRVYTNKTWPGGSHESKTITEVLLSRTGHTLVAFGYEARDKYASLSPKQQQEHLYFTMFKMTLHNEKGACRQKVKAANCDEEVPVIRVFAECLRAVKDRAMEELAATTATPLSVDMVRWVVTVPAIWDVAARHMMKEAAVLAGMFPKNIAIALEPEVASIWCLKNQLDIPSLHDSPYMVVDLGGGTVDITIHKMKTDGTLIEIHKPSGGHWGSTTINAEFSKMMETLIGPVKFAAVNSTDTWFDIMDNFEASKLRLQEGPNEPPVRNINIAALGADADIDRISSYNAPGTAIQLNRGILRIPTASFLGFFRPSIAQITQHIQHLLANDACKSVKHILLVGGYAESPILVSAIKESVGKRVKVICPPRPGSAVVIGAVQYGLDPGCISSRIAVATIGMAISSPWNESHHFGRHSLLDDDGVKFCTDTVATFISAGSRIDTNSTVLHPGVIPQHADQKAIGLSIFASAKKEMPFSNDPGVLEIGSLTLELPPQTMALPRAQRGISVTMKFGGTLFSVTATCKTTGKSISANFSFPLDLQSQN